MAEGEREKKERESDRFREKSDANEKAAAAGEVCREKVVPKMGGVLLPLNHRWHQLSHFLFYRPSLLPVKNRGTID